MRLTRATKEDLFKDKILNRKYEKGFLNLWKLSQKGGLDMNIKKVMSLALVFTMCISTSLPVNAANNRDNVSEDNLISKQTYIVDEETLNAEQRRAEEEILASLWENEPKTRGQYDYTYSVEWGSPKFITKGGYPGGQPTKGVKFSKPGGAFSWSPDGGPTVSASVSFSAPFKGGSISIALGIAQAGGGLQYSQTVNNYKNYVKLYVNKTMQVKPFVTYKIYRATGKKSVYTTGKNATMSSYEFKVYKVS